MLGICMIASKLISGQFAVYTMCIATSVFLFCFVYYVSVHFQCLKLLHFLTKRKEIFAWLLQFTAIWHEIWYSKSNGFVEKIHIWEFWISDKSITCLPADGCAVSYFCVFQGKLSATKEFYLLYLMKMWSYFWSVIIFVTLSSWVYLLWLPWGHQTICISIV